MSVSSQNHQLTEKRRVESQNRSNTENGLFWLSKLEQGEGHDIVIQWPKKRRVNAWLQRRLYGCGVRLGRWHKGRLSAIEHGQSTVSGFIRVLSGDMGANEQSRFNALAGIGQPVRLFPRSLDITLLAGFSALPSKSFLQAKDVRAQYEKRGNGVYINNIKIDGELYQQSIQLLPDSSACS